MTINRKIYLNMKTLKEAREIFFDCFFDRLQKKTQKIDVMKSVNRVLSEAVFAKISSPNYHAAAMDGIAVLAENTFFANENNPQTLKIGCDAFYVNTGHVMPDNTNAVIMIENICEINKDEIQIEAPAYPWQHVRKIGEDIVKTEMLFPQNHEVTPYCIGALIAGGIFKLNVWKKPEILIIPTGSELVDFNGLDLSNLKPGQIIESNSSLIGSLVKFYGAVFQRHDIVEDDPELISNVINKNIDKYDIILINGGSSAGQKDYSYQSIEMTGEVLIHGVTIMPGKPVVIGKVKQKPVLGMPGYPVSSIIVFEQFIMPLICHLTGRPEVTKNQIKVIPSRKFTSKSGIEEFLRVKLGNVRDKIIAAPLPRGAGLITSITEADGIIRIPNHIEGISEDETVYAHLLKPLKSIENTIIAVGSHDNTIDVLADEIKKNNSLLTLASNHVGSMGGILAIKKETCHFAGIHLLDTNDGTYNISYINKYLKNIKLNLINLVIREQGLIIQKSNPKNIRSIEDISRKDISFINRQAGSGTRILLDYKLKKANIDPDIINGYESEEYTHMAVAASIASGSADMGLGILSAARALDLDFIPVISEQYDLIIPDDIFKSKNIQLLLKIIRSDTFKKRVISLGGYNTQKTGLIIYKL